MITYKSVPKFNFNIVDSKHVPFVNVIDDLNYFKEHYNLDLTPNFQRNHIWSTKEQQNYIEYLIKGGIYTKQFYLNHPKWKEQDMKSEKLICLDGLQRIQSIVKFLSNELTIFNGHTWDEFSNQDKADISSDITLTFNILNIKNKKEIIQWYIDINFGGTIHQEDELNKVRNLMLLGSLEDMEEKDISVAEKLTGIRVRAWQFTGEMLLDSPPKWIKDNLIQSGKILCKEGNWYYSKDNKEFKKCWYILKPNGSIITVSNDNFKEYYIKLF